MELTLRQITNTLENHDERINAVKNKKLIPLNLKQKQLPNVRQQQSLSIKNILAFKECVSINTNQLDFGPCLPSSIHQRTFSLNLNRDLPEPMIFCMQITCFNQRLNQLPQFVFAIKKDRQVEFTDCYRFRLSKKGKYDFVIGVKTPSIMISEVVESELIIKWEMKKPIEQDQSQNDNQQKYTVNLKQVPYHPQIQCTKQLITSQSLNKELRVLKFSQIKSKLKKQVKIPFTLKAQSKITLLSELLGVQHDYSDLERSAIEIIPRQLVLTGSGVFLMTFRFNFTQQMTNYLQDLKNSSKNTLPYYTLRRILVMKVAQTNIHYHFPIQVSFFLGNKSASLTE